MTNYWEEQKKKEELKKERDGRQITLFNIKTNWRKLK